MKGNGGGGVEMGGKEVGRDLSTREDGEMGVTIPWVCVVKNHKKKEEK